MGMKHVYDNYYIEESCIWGLNFLFAPELSCISVASHVCWTVLLFSLSVSLSISNLSRPFLLFVVLNTHGGLSS